MLKWQCELCPYVYDPEVGDPDGGIPPGTPFEVCASLGCKAPSARVTAAARSRLIMQHSIVPPGLTRLPPAGLRRQGAQRREGPAVNQR